MADDFRVEQAEGQRAQETPSASCEGASTSTSREIHYAVPPNVIKAMADIATNAWKAKGKMVDATTGEVREEMKRAYRYIEAMFDTFQEIGLKITDHTGETFDYGLPLKVITTQPTDGITRESVIETRKPSIFWQNQLIQIGEVVVETQA